MYSSVRTGVSFGLNSAIITTLGLMVGLNSALHSELAVIGGILTIAIADAFSDALGIHISEEAEKWHTGGEVWEATLSTFFTKLVIAMTFLIPILLFPLSTAIPICIVYGLVLLAVFSFYIARKKEVSPWPVIGEHVAIVMAVVLITNFVGSWISATFV